MRVTDVCLLGFFWTFGISFPNSLFMYFNVFNNEFSNRSEGARTCGLKGLNEATPRTDHNVVLCFVNCLRKMEKIRRPMRCTCFGFDYNVCDEESFSKMFCFIFCVRVIQHVGSDYNKPFGYIRTEEWLTSLD